jgi:hypothetical protein
MVLGIFSEPRYCISSSNYLSPNHIEVWKNTGWGFHYHKVIFYGLLSSHRRRHYRWRSPLVGARGSWTESGTGACPMTSCSIRGATRQWSITCPGARWTTSSRANLSAECEFFVRVFCKNSLTLPSFRDHAMYGLKPVHRFFGQAPVICDSMVCLCNNLFS